MLGETQQQVCAFILEQEVGYYAPAFRGPKDTADPHIPYRSPSETPIPDKISPERLMLDEKWYAQDMVHQVHTILGKLRAAASLWLNYKKARRISF